MIIEIKDLPQDRKVKHFTIDVSFEENEPKVTVNEIDSTIKGSNPFVDKPVTCNVPSANPNITANVDAVSIPQNDVPREPKPVPAEMLDSEF